MENRKKLGALDFFIIIAIIAAILFVVIRFYFIKTSDQSETVVLDDYIVSYELQDVRNSTAENYLASGTKVFFADNNAYFGELREEKTVRDAQKFYELDDGTVVLSNTEVVGNLYRVDVEGSIAVKGMMDANGRFLVNGNTDIAPNKSVKIITKYLAVELTVTDITKAN